VLIGRAGGKVIVAYDNIDDAINQQSCLACMRYGAKIPCRLYAICRAGKRQDEPPSMFVEAMGQIIEKRCTTIRKEDWDGLKRISS
jgi:hypothetical protein